MQFELSNYIDEYLSSNHYRLLSGPIKEYAESILDHFARTVKNQKSESLSMKILEDILFKEMAALSLPLQVKKDIPDLLSSYFSYITQNGIYPEASLWDENLQILKKTYLEKFREDGTVKGETYKKKYSDTGRNDPCPCGSGLKFKKCCMKLME